MEYFVENVTFYKVEEEQVGDFYYTKWKPQGTIDERPDSVAP